MSEDKSEFVRNFIVFHEQCGFGSVTKVEDDGITVAFLFYAPELKCKHESLNVAVIQLEDHREVTEYLLSKSKMQKEKPDSLDKIFWDANFPK